MQHPISFPTLATVLVFALAACEIQVQDDTKKEPPKKPVTQEGFKPYTGKYATRAAALSQGLGTECDLSVEIQHNTKTLSFKTLEYECDDGTSWGFNQPMHFELRKPTDRLQLAHDIYYNGTYVGFINYSNNYAHIGLSQLGSSVTLALSQNNKGASLEDFRVSSNGWLLFDATPALLKKSSSNRR